MVFEYRIMDSSGREIRVGQIHVDQADEIKALAEALDRRGAWLSTNYKDIGRVPASVWIARATIG